MEKKEAKADAKGYEMELASPKSVSPEFDESGTERTNNDGLSLVGLSQVTKMVKNEGQINDDNVMDVSEDQEKQTPSKGKKKKKKRTRAED